MPPLRHAPFCSHSPIEDASAGSASLLAQMRDIIREELSLASAHITDDLLKEIIDIGGYVSALEACADDATVVLTAHEVDISCLQGGVNELKLKLEDLENLSRAVTCRSGAPLNLLLTSPAQ